jgi:eukaryotic-like serine/threonine-protein kinase
MAKGADGPPVVPGDILAGKYQVDRVLGSGGMGVVVAARHVELGQYVALKFLLPEACEIPQAVERFLREAKASVQIRSEHVARVIDVGKLENGAPYIVMEFLEGIDIAQLIKSRGVVPILEAADYLLQASEAVAEAHALGVVHRDLKPANLFLTRRADGSPLVKVLDFGISKALTGGASTDPSLTATAAIMGSPLYMSPEQVRNAKGVDARTDVWSLGVILYEMLTGKLPFEADTLPGLLAKIVADPPVPVRHHRADLPPDLELFFVRCFEKDLTRRFGTIADFADALARFASPFSRTSVERVQRLLRGSSTGSSTAVSAPNYVQTGDPRADSAVSWGQTRQSAPRGKPVVVLALIGAVVSLVAIAVGVGLMVGRRSEAGSAAPMASAGPETTAPAVVPPPAVPVATTAAVDVAAVSPPVASTAPSAEPSPSVAARPAAVRPRATGTKSRPDSKPEAKPEQKPAVKPGVDVLEGRR